MRERKRSRLTHVRQSKSAADASTPRAGTDGQVVKGGSKPEVLTAALADTSLRAGCPRFQARLTPRDFSEKVPSQAD